MKIRFFHSSNQKSKQAYEYMVERYGQYSSEEADYAVILSGDGTILKAFHENYPNNLPVYGMNLGELGFLTNKYQVEDLLERIQRAVPLKFHPLKAQIEKNNGERFTTIAVNEVYLLRETHQSAKLQVKINEEVMIKELVCDGLINASEIGSTAYNYSAGGAIIPMGSSLMALTPISSFRPRGWRGALLPDDTVVELEVWDNFRRPVCAVADYVEFREVVKVKICCDKSTELCLLLDPDNCFRRKVIKEQFAT